MYETNICLRAQICLAACSCGAYQTRWSRRARSHPFKSLTPWAQHIMPVRTSTACFNFIVLHHLYSLSIFFFFLFFVSYSFIKPWAHHIMPIMLVYFWVFSCYFLFYLFIILLFLECFWTNPPAFSSFPFPIGCPRCQKPLFKHGYECEHCRTFTNTCSVCHKLVKGLYAWCQGCGHGGHVRHMDEWFQRNAACPVGCGHLCNYKPSVARRKRDVSSVPAATASVVWYVLIKLPSSI